MPEIVRDVYVGLDRIRTYVRWLSLRGHNVNQIRLAVKDRWGGRFLRATNKAIEFEQSLIRAGRNLLRRVVTKPIKLLDAPTTQRTPAGIRVGVDFDFRNPETGETTERIFFIDFPSGLTQRDVLKQTRDKIREWAFQYYDFRTGGARAIDRSIRDLKIRSVEGV